MEYWQRYDDKRFDTEEEAYQDCLENEDVDTLEDYLLTRVELDASTLLHWAIKQDGFWEEFQDEIVAAREMMFEDHYCHWEGPDDIDELIAEMEQKNATTPKHHYAVDAWGDIYEVNHFLRK